VRSLNIYTDTAHVGVYILDPPTYVTLFGREVDSSTHYIIAEQEYAGRPNLLWGFDGSPDAMTETGKKLFVNAAWHID